MDETSCLKVIKDVENHGYSIAKQVLKPKTINQVQKWLELEEKNRPALLNHDKFHGNKVLLINNLHSIELLFWELISHPLIISACDGLLNKHSYKNCEGYTLVGSSIRAVYGQQKAQQLHIDSNLPGCNYILHLQCCFPLDSFTKESGATRLILGSQNTKEFAPEGNILSKEHESNSLVVEAEPGDLIIFNAGMWHGASEKTTSSRRAAIFINYARWFFKQSFDIANNMPESIHSNLTDDQLRIAGCYYQPPFDSFESNRRKSEVPVIRNYELK